MKTFDFISDDRFREILERDFHELQLCMDAKCSKSVLILVGSIIEAILIDYFKNFPVNELTEEKALKESLKQLIDLAGKYSIISQSTKELSTVVKNYRNLIHPGREVRKKEKFCYDTAIVANSLLNLILDEIRENYLDHIGYSASDIIAKLETDALSQPIFDRILLKVHKTEKNKLFVLLCEYEYFFKPSGNDLRNPTKYIMTLKSKVDRKVIESQLHKLIHIIETGQKCDVMALYTLLYEEITYLKQDEVEFVLLYVIDAVRKLSDNEDAVASDVKDMIYTSFGSYVNIKSIEQEFLRLVCSIVMNHHKRDYVYFEAYDQLVNSVSSETREIVKKHVLEKVSSYHHEPFYEGYNDGNFPPF